MKSEKGFSLIELLVVIAIMGILATIALAALNSARTKSADAAVKTEMNNMKAQAEVYYDTKGYYNANGSATAATCAVTAATRTINVAATTGMFADPIVVNMLNNILKNVSQVATSTVVCSTDSVNSQTWAVSVTDLRGGGTWCVDNQGKNGPGSTSAGSGKCT